VGHDHFGAGGERRVPRPAQPLAVPVGVLDHGSARLRQFARHDQIVAS
jgi:hypothetical protein